MSKLRSIQEVDFPNWCIILFKLSGILEADFQYGCIVKWVKEEPLKTWDSQWMLINNKLNYFI